MTALPSTTKEREVRRRWPLYALVAVALAAIALSVEAFLRAESFSPREEIVSPSILDVAVSEEDSLYPPLDAGYFEGRPETIFVYLTVEGLPTGEDMEARVEREGSGSIFSLFFGQRDGIEAFDEQEDHLRKGENGGAGVVKFALKTSSGGPVPSGNYTVDIYGPGVEGAVAARKFFVVEG